MPTDAAGRGADIEVRHRHPRRLLPAPADVALAFALVYPTLALLRMPGWAVMAAYVLGAALALAVLKARLPGLFPRLRAPAAGVALVLALGALAALHLYVHPRIDVTGFTLGSFSVGPSDADDAIDLALERLLSGRYPYHARTFLDNPISPMAGALLLALPFHLAGATALQNLFWLAIFCWMVARRHQDVRVAAWLLALTIALSPALVYHLVQGIDYVSNGIYVLAASLGILHGAAEGRRARTLLFSVLFGVALASRLNFLLLVPLVILPVHRRCGPGLALAVGGTAAAAFLALTLPFYLYDPAGFSPLHTVALAPSVAAVPLAFLLAPALAGVLALRFGLRAGGERPEVFAKSAFLVQAALLGASLILASAADGAVPIRFAHYGVLAMFFGLYGFGPEFLREATNAEHERAGTAEYLQADRRDGTTGAGVRHG